MINLKRVSSEYLKNLYKNSNNIKNSRKYKNIKYYCLEPIIIERDKEIYVSKEWCINSNDELIYIIEKNRYFNLEMYNNDESFVSDVYIIEIQVIGNKHENPELLEEKCKNIN